MKSLIENITAIQLESPVDKIIGQLKQLIVSGQLKPGDRLPAERVLSERFGVGRSYIREAILKLEFYGLLKTNPQSGTYVAGLSINVIDTLISDIIKFNKDDFKALIEARYHLELTAVQLAAERRTEEDLEKIKEAMEAYESKILVSEDAVEEDMIFHIRIAQATKNSVIESMILVLIPDLIKKIVDTRICVHNRAKNAIIDHREVLQAIEKGDPQLAKEAMGNHLDEIWQISKSGLIAENMIEKAEI